MLTTSSKTTQVEDYELMETQALSISEKRIRNSQVTFIGVEHEASPNSYPWQGIQQHIESAGESGKIVLEYFPAELEQTIYNHPILGCYAKRYSENAGIASFFGGMGSIAAVTRREVIVLDPANNATFQLLYLHLPLAAIALGAGWGCYEALQTMRGNQRSRTKLLQRLAAGTLSITGLEGVSWFLQDRPSMRSLQRLYRDNSVNMRDMRWVTIAQGLVQYCGKHEQNLSVLYPPAHMEGILHYLNRPDERKRKYAFYSSMFSGITKAIREYRFEHGQWRLTKREPITANLETTSRTTARTPGS